MAIETLSITSQDDTLITDIARQRHMDEGMNELNAADALRTAVENGQSITALREMNTNAILRVTVAGKNVIDKITTVSV